MKNKNRHLVFDCESTGLFPSTLLPLDKLPEIFEFYGVVCDMDRLEITDEELHVFSRPTKKMEDGAKKATGKTDEDMLKYPPFSENAARIKSLIESCDAVVAHNLAYDWRMIDFEFARLRQTINWPRKICTVESTIHIEGFRLTNTALYEYLFNEKFSNAHEADADTKALARSYLELVRRGVI